MLQRKSMSTGVMALLSRWLFSWQARPQTPAYNPYVAKDLNRAVEEALHEKRQMWW